MKLNNPSPLVPQGSLPDKRGKSQVRIFVFTIIAVHAVFLGALLLQGCKRTTGTEGMASNVDTNYPPPPIDTSTPPSTANAAPQSFAQNAVPPIIETQSTPVVQTSGTPSVASAPPRMEIPPPSPGPTTGGSEHVVVKGDVYSTIAKKYGVSVKSLTEANPGVNPSRLKIGQKLAIPAGSTTASTASAAPNGSGAGEKTYVVKSGDSLMKIARENGTTLKSLRAANKLKTDQIKVGQKLVIPAKGTPDTGVGGTSGAPQTLPAP
jgi:LysM repeat protein